ncbi:tetratricopeptide repeat protein [Leptolyngbya sp. GGD]|uniref:tetratricopeptide repeat protein n=1 Tax=Leptolyngbya sp. GGD TaxID=2997907 RepID=UPI00227B1DA1|nr:tetratricopeptide repeat protein [Leptolyngbya sp. GGD]MCY6494591.1 tetratricopeptide repeat protein [Leptolyngbya sp. GGD]
MGRTIELARLDEIFQTSDRTVISAVAGMGGLGKTQLAVQYARRNQAKFSGGVCWLNGQTGELATQVILKAEFDLQLKGLDKAKEQLIETDAIALWCWRHWQPEGQVLVVVDDVANWAKVRSVLPTDDRFRVLVTTRRQDLLSRDVTIPLDVLEPDEARSLLAKLENHGRVEQDQESADQLCAALGYLPLGIELVGCYLRRDRYRTLSQIIKSLQAKGMQDPALVRSDEYEMLAERGVKAAFDLTWETLEPEAQQVARLLSYFALDWIEWNLAERVMRRVEGDEYELGGLKAQLENASIVQFEPDRLGWCRLHPLVRQYLKEEEASVIQQAGEAVLHSAFVEGMIAISSRMPDNPPTKKINEFEGVRSHVQEVAEGYIEGLEGSDLTWSFIALARFYEGQGLYRQAEAWCAECLKTTESRFAGDHLDVAQSLNNLAELYRVQGRLSEAEALYVRSLEMNQRLFEDDHPDVASSLNNLAGLYHSQGRLSEAEALFVRSLEMRQRLFEDDHLDVALSLNNLAGLYHSQGRLSEAEALFVRSLEMRQCLFEDDHPDVAQSLNNLAELYRVQGRLSEAEALYVRSLEMRQRLFEDDHPDVAQSLNNLAALYYSQGRLSEVEALYVRSLEMNQRLFEDDHPDVALSLNNLAGLYRVQGRLSEAEALYVRSFEMNQRLFEDDHPDVALSLNNLAELYYSQGRLSEAEALYVRSFEMNQRLFEDDHPDVALSLNNLAGLYYSQGRLSEAEALYVRSLEMRQRLFEDDHPDVAQSLNNLAELYRVQGRLSEAEALYVRSLEMNQRLFEDDHPDVALSLNNLGAFYYQQGRVMEAEPLLARALAMREKILGAGHPDTIVTRQWLAMVYRAM